MSHLDIAKLQEEKAELVQKVEALSSTCEQLRSQCDQLEIDNSSRTEEMEEKEKGLRLSALDENSFRDNDEKVLYRADKLEYTLHSFYLCSTLYLHEGSRTFLSPFQQLMLTLMRLRLSLSGQDLAYRFGLHSSAVSHTFNNVLNILYVRLKCLIIWPEREVLRRTIPMDFRKHSPNCAVIIDCFEIFIDRPSNLKARGTDILILQTPQYGQIPDWDNTPRKREFHIRRMGR